MVWLLLVFAAISASEVIVRLPLFSLISALASAARKSAAVLRSARISDHWKERALRAYSLRIAADSILLLVMMCSVAVPAMLMGLFFPGGLGAWEAELMRPVSLLVVSLVSLSYVTIRLKTAGG